MGVVVNEDAHTEADMDGGVEKASCAGVRGNGCTGIESAETQALSLTGGRRGPGGGTRTTESRKVRVMVLKATGTTALRATGTTRARVLRATGAWPLEEWQLRATRARVTGAQALMETSSGDGDERG